MKRFRADSQKQSPFECGFTPKLPSRTPFSLQYFLIALIFLIFDMELILLYPFLNFSHRPGRTSLAVFILFLGALTFRFFIEWSQGMLEWVK